MLDLRDFTLICADTRNHDLALRALRISAKHCRFGRVLFFTDRKIGSGEAEIIPIAPLGSATEYSRLMIKGLQEHLHTPFALIVQWDGYVIHPEAWQDRFREFDYIGARWPWLSAGRDVGNGGFSLRSKRLLEALADSAITDFPIEDVAIGQTYRPLLEKSHAIRFAPADVADCFSFEVTPLPQPTFGFHALFNFWLTVPEADLPSILASLADANTDAPQLRVLGVNYLLAGRRSAAAQVFRRILEARPGDAEVARLLRHAESAQKAPLAGRTDPCPCGSGRRFKACHGALGPGSAPSEATTTGGPAAPASLERALQLHESGQVDAACAIYREILGAQPDDPVATHFLGVAAMQRKDLDTALPLLTRAAALRPEEANFHNNLGLALVEADRIEEALVHYQRSLELDPGNAGAWSNLGLARQALGDPAGAIAAFQQALSHAPGFVRARWNLAFVLLLCGRFDEGWRAYDARLAIEELGGTEAKITLPRWNGRVEPGLRIEVVAEQGLGDTLQFARYLPLLAAAGAVPTLACDAVLHPVLASLPGALRLVGRGVQDPECTAQFPLASLPQHFGTRPETIPAAVPYLTVDPQGVRQWEDWLGPRQGLRVGVVWAGNPAHTNDRQRSVALGKLRPLLELAGISWFSLQLGAGREQLALVPEALRPRDAAQNLRDFGDTAALITALDLVLSVDTSVAHLAGALNRPVWIMLPFAPDWRWQLEREDSPWYPSARLFRQSRRGDWSSVLERVARALDAARGVL